jgi:hypothetical protein
MGIKRIGLSDAEASIKQKAALANDRRKQNMIWLRKQQKQKIVKGKNNAPHV